VSGTWAIIPVKRFDRAKSRLGHALALGERRELAASLFERVLGACRAGVERGVLDHVLVATDSPDIARRAATPPTCSALLDARPSGSFAHVVDRALAHAHASGAARALVIMADLPHVSPSDVAELLAALTQRDLVLAPDRSRRGVGALGCALPAPMQAQLGQRDSFTRHLLLAQQRGLRVGIVHNPRLAADIDTLDDLQRASGYTSLRFSAFAAAAAAVSWR
jgi:2-phospho-L-lactate guanylyltransferase